MNKEILDYIKKNSAYIEELICNRDIGNIIELILSNKNKKLFLEIRDKSYKQMRVNIVVFSKIYKILKVKNRIGIIRESYNYNLYEWLQTKPSNNEIKLIKKQLNILNSILDKKIDKLENIWIKKINKGFPIMIKGTPIEHNGNLVGVLNFGGKRLSIKKINNEIRLKNLRRLYSIDELERMYSNILNMIEDNIYQELINNNIDNELILRRLEYGRIAKLL